MGVYLLGIVQAQTGLEFGEIGCSNAYGEKSHVSTISYGGIAMAVCHPEGWELRKNDKSDLLNKLLEHQRALEKIMQRQFVLPVKFGTIVDDDRDVIAILKRYRPLFQKAMTKMSPFIEIDVVGIWDEEQMVKKMAAEDEEIKRMKVRIEGMPPDKRGTEVLAIGQLLEKKLERQRASVERTIFRTLAPVSDDRADHERLEGRMVVNTSFLVDRSREEAFFEAMEALDKELHRGLKFKCLSPLPPHSFQTIVIQKIEIARLKKAMELFSVTGATTLKELESRNRELTKLHHPDKAKGDAALFAKVNASFHLLSSLCQGQGEPFCDVDLQRSFQVVIRREEMPLAEFGEKHG